MHENFRHKINCQAYHFWIEYSSPRDVKSYDLGDLLDMIAYVLDYFHLHPISYGIFVNGKALELHFLLDPMHFESVKYTVLIITTSPDSAAGASATDVTLICVPVIFQQSNHALYIREKAEL